ncbi:Histidine biosynthesis bifunctional protein hisB [Podila epicladia]|nr:Histidine biosynthesis bifunctional protein hisB [Podila epicladia]
MVLIHRYFEEDAEEITFLNINIPTFRTFPLLDMPMLEILAALPRPDYFRNRADKVSIGSETVYASEKYYALGGRGRGDGASVMDTIAHAYGSQTVGILVGPKRVYVHALANAPTHHVVQPATSGPNDEKYC